MSDEAVPIPLILLRDRLRLLSSYVGPLLI